MGVEPPELPPPPLLLLLVLVFAPPPPLLLLELFELDPQAATTSAVIATSLVLIAVFVPVSFFPGATGILYRQFSLTIVSAMALSVLVALIFTPALCATLLLAPNEGAERVTATVVEGELSEPLEEQTLL